MKKTHSESFVVKATECDTQRRMRLNEIFIAMQEGGERHAVQLGAGYESMMARGVFFVLARIHVHVDRMPMCGETVVHTTWPGVSNRFFCPRFHTFALEDGTPLACAGALWVMLDVNERKIVSPKGVELGFPDTSDILQPLALPTRMPPMGEATLTIERTPAYSDYDINGHVNNTRYISWLCDALGNSLLRSAWVGDLTCGYEKEIREDEPMTLSLALDGDDFSFLVSSQDGAKRFVAGGRLTREEQA